jgi:hypothetical protein
MKVETSNDAYIVVCDRVLLSTPVGYEEPASEFCPTCVHLCDVR